MLGIYQFVKSFFLNGQQIAHFLMSSCLIAERIERCTVEKVFKEITLDASNLKYGFDDVYIFELHEKVTCRNIYCNV